MSHQTSFNLIRKVPFTPELKQYLKSRAHTLYDEIYFNLYVGDFPSDQLPNEADDAGHAFEWNWLRQVTEPLLAGYSFANPTTIPMTCETPCARSGITSASKWAGKQREDYDEVEQQSPATPSISSSPKWKENPHEGLYPSA